MKTMQISSFYRFCEIAPEHLEQRKAQLEGRAAELKIVGLLILATEGINGTFAGEPSQVDAYQTTLLKIFGGSEWNFKHSLSSHPPFRGFRVKLRPEIVTTRSPVPVQVREGGKKLSPEDWHLAMQKFSREDAVLIDTRNRYETKIGVFRGATDPNLNNFQEFEQFVEEAQIPKDKKIFMYCTGGIRCEKASIQMERMGYSDVYQLDGGILRYLERFPHEFFEGECFVFDNRVAVDQELQPSAQWTFCPHCGDPGGKVIQCRHCGCRAKICDNCAQFPQKETCSKNCANHYAKRAADCCSPVK